MKKWVILLILFTIAIGGTIGAVYYFQSKSKPHKTEVTGQKGEVEKPPKIATEQIKTKKVKTDGKQVSYISYFINRKLYLQTKQNDFYTRYHAIIEKRRNALVEGLIQKLKRVKNN
ncbi:MAG: hypothetical protein ABUK01_12515 [Leptospirales bacterium]